MMGLLTIALFAACQGSKSDPPSSAGDDTATGDGGADIADTGSDDSIEVPEDNITNALGDCMGYQREPDEYPNQLAAGAELQRYTLEDPEAVCNDGTRAVLYVRGWTDEALSDVWSIHLQGGSGCGGYASCAIRWCGLDYYDRSKMSSRDLPLNIAGFGIYDAKADNVLAGANHAYFYYCSSDSWNGQGSAAYDAGDLELEPEELDKIPFKLPDYTIFRRGHHILASGLDELEAGIVADDGETLPALADASVVVFSGTSAGSTGARHNADYVAERLEAHGTAVFAIFDAANTPLPEAFDDEYSDAIAEVQQNSWELALATEDIEPFRDESCVAQLAGNDNEWRCMSADYVSLHHVTTPFFMRQDLRDVTGIAESAGVPEDVYEQAVADMLTGLADIQSTATDGADITVIPGAYGPNCSQHVALESQWWASGTVSDGDGTDWSFQDAVVSWYQGNDVSIVDEPVAGDGDGPASNCIDTDNEH